MLHPSRLLSTPLVHVQVDVVIDESSFDPYDPTIYSMASFLATYNITGNMASANASFPFLRNAAVYRCVSFVSFVRPS